MSINLKSKKLIILISVLVAVIAVIVILATVFSVQEVNPVIHDFSGALIQNPKDSPTADAVLEFSRGNNIIFMSKDDLLNKLNEKFPQWHAFAVVKNFPNRIDVHFVERQPAVKIDIGGNFVYVDTFGYVVAKPNEGDCINISSVFNHSDITVNELGKPLQFKDASNNERLKIVLEDIVLSWRCNFELGDLPEIKGSENVFTFDIDGNLIITTRAEAQIKIVDPSVDLTNRLLAAYSVYYNDSLNLQQKGIVITVDKNGHITTPNTNK